MNLIWEVIRKCGVLAVRHTLELTSNKKSRGSGTYADVQTGPHMILGRVYAFMKRYIFSSDGHGRGFSLVRTWFKYVPLPLYVVVGQK